MLRHRDLVSKEEHKYIITTNKLEKMWLMKLNTF